MASNITPRQALEIPIQNIIVEILEERYQDNPPSTDAKEFNEENAVSITSAIMDYLFADDAETKLKKAISILEDCVSDVQFAVADGVEDDEFLDVVNKFLKENRGEK